MSAVQNANKVLRRDPTRFIVGKETQIYSIDLSPQYCIIINMFNFAARINRSTFIVHFVLSTILTVVLLVILDTVAVGTGLSGDIAGILMLLVVLTTIIYWAGLMRQRANDITGRHPLILFAFALMSPVILLLVLLPSQSQANRYGDIPSTGIKLK